MGYQTATCLTYSIQDYDFLPVKNRVVIDIGADIADSSIYFAMIGAKKVIALEPFPKNFEVAQKNITLNGFNEDSS